MSNTGTCVYKHTKAQYMYTQYVFYVVDRDMTKSQKYVHPNVAEAVAEVLNSDGSL